MEHKNKNIFVLDSDGIKEADIATKHLIYWPKYTNAHQGHGSSICQFITCKQ